MSDTAIKALIKAQQSMESVKKDSLNPHFKNRYASLEAVIDATSKVFQKHGFAVMQPSGRDELGVFVETRLLHESGDAFFSKVYLVLSSAITYARRYGLLGMACLAPEDDDGNLSAKQDKSRSSEDTPASSGW
mgnify:CR=1 FL=1